MEAEELWGCREEKLPSFRRRRGEEATPPGQRHLCVEKGGDIYLRPSSPRATQAFIPPAHSPLITDPRHTCSHTTPHRRQWEKSRPAHFQSASFPASGPWLGPQDTAETASSPRQSTRHRQARPEWGLSRPRGGSHSSAPRRPVCSQGGGRGAPSRPAPAPLPRGGEGARWSRCKGQPETWVGSQPSALLLLGSP